MAFKEVKSEPKKLGTLIESENGSIEFLFEAELALYDRSTRKYYKLKKAVNKADNTFEVDFDDKEQVEYLGSD